MAVLPGYKLTSGWLTQASDHLNIAAVDAFDNALFDDRGASSTPEGSGGAAVASTPAPRPHRALPGVKLRSFSDDWYHRIHITPRRLDLGNILSTQISTVTVWNAYLVPRSLVSINGVVEGMAIDGHLPLFDFQALAQFDYDITITQDGASRVDTTLLWTCTDAYPARLPVTADRVFIFSFLPDWEDGITEHLEWMTEILASKSMLEQRRSLRIAPRRYFSAQLYVDGRERQFLDLALFEWSARIWGLPIWPEVQTLSTGAGIGSYRINCQTADLDFYVGGLAILLGGNAFESEGVVVSGIDAAGIDLDGPLQKVWPAGSRLYPARIAQLRAEPDITRLTDQAVSVDVDFQVMENCDWTAVLPVASHQGYPVLETRPDETDDLTSGQVRLLATLDSGSSLPQVTDVAGVAMRLRSWKWLGYGRAERAAFRSLLYALRGQQVPVWVPSHADDLTVVTLIGATSTAIDIAYCGYARFGRIKPGRRDIRIELFSGAVHHCRIVGCSDVSPTVERLQIDTPIGVLIMPDQISRVSWMSLSRLSSDTVTIEHDADSEGIASCALTFREVRDDAV